jgi:hypothetical protein
MPLIPFGDYRPDVSDYEGQATRNIRNVIPRGDGYGPFPGLSTYTSALPSACRGAFYALKSDGTVITFAGTGNKLYRLDNTDFSWSDVSLGSGTYAALSSSAQWQFAQTGNFVFATQANAALQVFDLSSSSAFSNALGTPPQAAYISVVGKFLVLSGLLSSPYRIQWSGLNNFNAADSWTSGVKSSDFQDFPDGGIVRGVAGGEAGVIFQDQAIRRMSYVPGSPIIFQIDRITQDKGLYAPYSIIRAGERVFFYAGQGFHKIEPGGIPEQIGREKVDRTFLADLDKGNLQLFVGAADPRSTRVYWAYKSVSGAVGTTYDRLLGYDFLLDRFFPVSVTGEYLLGVSQTGLTLENLDSISASLDALTLSLDAYATAVQPEIGQFNGSHALGFFRGANLEAMIESAEQGTDENRISIRGFRPVTDAATLYGSVSYRDTLSVAATSGMEVLVNTRTGRCDLMRDTRYSRFKVRIPAESSWTFCAGVVPDLTTGGTL